MPSAAVSPSSTTPHLLQTPFGTVQVLHAWGDVDPALWEATFGRQAKDGRFYRIAEHCLRGQFEFLYLVLTHPSSGQSALQTALVVDQDATAGLPTAARRLLQSLRHIYPRFLQLRLLMVGCSAGEGVLASAEPWALQTLHHALPGVARLARTSVIVMKDFPAEARPLLQPVFGRDYRRVPGMPAATLDLAFPSFEDYLQRKVSKVFRKNLRRKFKKLESTPPLHMEVIADATHLVPQLFPLYWQTYERSDFHFEVLNPEFFERLGREMADKTRFFIWRQEGRIIAFNVCLVHDGVIYDLDLGMDYSVALDLHMYFVTWRDIVQWSIQNGLRMYHTGPLNYDPKLHLKLKLAPQDLWARHVNRLINPFFKIAMYNMGPVAHDPIIRQFDNFADL